MAAIYDPSGARRLNLFRACAAKARESGALPLPPYRFVCEVDTEAFDGANSCDLCGQLIRYEWWFEGRAGVEFKLGSDCGPRLLAQIDGLADRQTFACELAKAQEGLGSKAQETTLALASFILTSDKDRFTPSDFTAGVRAVRNMDTWELFKQASLLVALGWLIEEGKGRTPSAWVVPRGLRANLAHRREEEVARKERVCNLITEMAERRRAERRQDE